MTRDADTGKGGVDNASLRDIVEAYNCHLFRHLVASEPQGLDSSDCNQVIVRKITVCQSIPSVNNCKHICHCTINGWRKLVDDTAGTGHSVIMDSMIKSLQTLWKVAERVSRLQVSRLFHSPADQIIGSKISSLTIIGNDIIAVKVFKIGVQDHHRKRKLQERTDHFLPHFSTKQNNSHTVSSS